MTLPTISVAMATYNGATYLREQLDSIAAQTHLPAELVIGDDGSRDDTVRIAETFAAEAPFPVRIVRNATNLGFADNFLTTAERCTGGWIAFSDQDDVWLPTKLERLAREISVQDDELKMICHVADVVDSQLRPLGIKLPAIDRTELVPPNSKPGFWCIGGCVMAVRGALVREIDFRLRPPDDYPGSHKVPGTLTQLPHDKWMSMLANSLGTSLMLAETLACYRRHDTAVTGSKASVSAAARVATARTAGSEAYRFRADVARRTGAALEALAAEQDDRRAQRLRATARRYTAMADILAARAHLYEQPTAFARLRQFAGLLRRRAYFGDRLSRLGGLAAVKDMAFCVTRGLVVPTPR